MDLRFVPTPTRVAGFIASDGATFAVGQGRLLRCLIDSAERLDARNICFTGVRRGCDGEAGKNGENVEDDEARKIEPSSSSAVIC